MRGYYTGPGAIARRSLAVELIDNRGPLKRVFLAAAASPSS